MTDQSTDPRLKFFPVSFFAMVMGLTGLSIAWHKAENAFGLNVRMSGAVLALAVVCFVLLLGLYLSWWAYSFPLAAITIASLIMHEHTGLIAFAAIGWVLLTFVTLAVVFLLYRTALAVSSRKICIAAI